MAIDARYIQKVTGLKILSVDRTNSTFDDIGEYDAIVAREQAHGAGRGDHTFFSPFGGIYLVMRESGLNIDAHTLTPAVGLAVHDAIKSVLKLDTSLKWVNDIYYNGKKICGILCRSPRRGEYLIGVGINYAVRQSELDGAGLGDIAGTLDASEFYATRFTCELVKRIRSASLLPFDYKRYNKLCMTVGKQISFVHNGVDMQGTAEYVERDGTLIVKIGQAQVAVDSGEVNLIRSV